jgi:hypothetical protein
MIAHPRVAEPAPERLGVGAFLLFIDALGQFRAEMDVGDVVDAQGAEVRFEDRIADDAARFQLREQAAALEQVGLPWAPR